MKEPLKPVALLVRNTAYGEQGEPEFFVIEMDSHEAIKYMIGAIPTYTESQIEAARAEGRRAGLEEAAKLVAAGGTSTDVLRVASIRALADKAEGET